MQIIQTEPQASEGRKNALLIGINYHALPKEFTVDKTQKSYKEIFGSHFDVQRMASFLTVHQGWPLDAMRIMTDDPTIEPHLQPTRANILHELKQLAEDARPGDHLFLQFSGHGDQIPDEDFDEVDGMDEVIITSDAQLITDDEMHEILIRKIPAGCHMSVLFDCCSSGTALDLPVFPDASVFLDSPVRIAVDSPQMMDFIPSPQTPQTLPSPTGVTRAARNFYQEPQGSTDSDSFPTTPVDPLSILATGRPYPPIIRTTGFRPEFRKKYSSGDVVMWSSCRDSEESGEVKLVGDERSGAMTHAFIESMISNEYRAHPTYHNLLNCIRHRIQSYQLQKPQHVQFSSSHDLDPEQDYTV